MKNTLKMALLTSVIVSTNNYADTNQVANTNPISKKEYPPAYIKPITPDTTTDSSKIENPLTGTFNISTNYMFRGVTNSNNNPAAQGGFTYTFPSGIYFNIWGSNVDFADPKGNIATVEFDTIAGIRNDVTDNLSYDINIDRYNYPGATPASYYEGIAVVTYYIFSGTLGYSSNVYGSHQEGYYTSLAVNYDLPGTYKYTDNVTLTASVGHYDLPEDAGLISYNDFLLGITKNIGQYSLILQWTDTTNSHQGQLADSHITGTVLVNF